MIRFFKYFNHRSNNAIQVSLLKIQHTNPQSNQFSILHRHNKTECAAQSWKISDISAPNTPIYCRPLNYIVSNNDTFNRWVPLLISSCSSHA